MSNQLTVTTFYKFTPFADEDLQQIQLFFQEASKKDLKGLLLIGSEGLNGTLSGPHEMIEEVKSKIRLWVKDPEQIFKDSFSEHHPFIEFKLKVKPEIVTLGRPDLIPSGQNQHLSPQDWHQMMGQEDVIVLDTRNDYETRIGKFQNAVDMEITDFHDFPDRIKELNLPKEKKVMMYCTGGIRCEKAILELQEQGFQHVYQLDGGILNYLKEFPNQKFDGECFVFDYRVAVDQNLNPSQTYRLCAHCGDPTGHKITCVKCQSEGHVCQSCLKIAPDKETCSKNCAHHFRISSRSTRQQKDGIRQKAPGS